MRGCKQPSLLHAGRHVPNIYLAVVFLHSEDVCADVEDVLNVLSPAFQSVLDTVPHEGLLHEPC